MTYGMDTKENELIDRILRNFDRVSGDRGVFESHWEEIAERMLPEHRNTLRKGSTNTPGMRKTEFMLDTTAAIALSRFAAIMSSILTPDNWVWHRLKTSNHDLNAERSVRLYFEDVNRILWDERRRPSANYAGQNFQVNQALGAYGNGILFTDENLVAGGMRYKYCHIGRTYIQENHQGIVDRIYREEKFKGFQILEQAKWKDALSKEWQDKLGQKPEVEYTVIHHVCPRTDGYDPTRLDYRRLPYASYYIMREAKCFLQQGGYRIFPFAVGRYEQVMDEVYGRSPAMMILPNVKTLNEMKRTFLKQGHRIIDPVLFTHDDNVVDGWSLEPGSMNNGGVNSDGRLLVNTLPVGNLAINDKLMDQERAPINDVFLISLFQILAENPQMTATEVLERSREKGILLAPAAGRQQSERLGPQIEREIDILAAQGRLPPMPPVMIEAKGEYSVEYDNDLTRAARAQEAAAFERSVQEAVAIAGAAQKPELLDWFNFDNALPEISQIRGSPERWMNDIPAVAQARQQRQQMMQQQMAMQAAPGMAAMVSSAAKAKQAGIDPADLAKQGGGGQ